MITKHLKILLSEAYEVEGELVQIIEQCFKEIFQEHGPYAFSLFEDDIKGGREYCGCLQSLDYYKEQIATSKALMKKHKEKNGEIKKAVD